MFDQMAARGHEEVVLAHHAPSGLRAVIAVHSTVLGPAIAPCRLMPIDEEDALRDALALSESLTLKAALAGLNRGGGACVVTGVEFGEHEPHAREALFRALGRRVQTFGGRVVLAEDVGVGEGDIAFAAQETVHTLGMHTDTPAITAYGVYRGLKAAARVWLGGESMRGVRVAVLGAGTVGRTLVGHLLREGARLTVADRRPDRAQDLADEFEGRVAVVPADALFDVPCDVLAPCGFGRSIRRADIPRLQAVLIAGSEHNPIAPEDLPLVREAGIVYVPDFALNAAGLIAATGATADEAAERVYQNVARVSAEANRTNRPASEVARDLALRRIELIGSLGGRA